MFNETWSGILKHLYSIIQRFPCMKTVMTIKKAFKNQMSYVIANASKSLGYIFHIAKNFTFICCLKSLNCLLVHVTSEYFSAVWYPLNQNGVQNIDWLNVFSIHQIRQANSTLQQYLRRTNFRQNIAINGLQCVFNRVASAFDFHLAKHTIRNTHSKICLTLLVQYIPCSILFYTSGPGKLLSCHQVGCSKTPCHPLYKMTHQSYPDFLIFPETFSNFLFA